MYRNNNAAFTLMQEVRVRLTEFQNKTKTTSIVSLHQKVQMEKTLSVNRKQVLQWLGSGFRAVLFTNKLQQSHDPHLRRKD